MMQYTESMMQYKCATCGSQRVQISLPAWFDLNKDLSFVEADVEAEALSFYCEDGCDDTSVISPEGELLEGRW